MLDLKNKTLKKEQLIICNFVIHIVIIFNLWQRTDWSSNPSDDQHYLGESGVGKMREGSGDGIESVNGDHNHDEAGEIESNNPKIAAMINLMFGHQFIK